MLVVRNHAGFRRSASGSTGRRAVSGPTRSRAQPPSRSVPSTGPSTSPYCSVRRRCPRVCGSGGSMGWDRPAGRTAAGLTRAPYRTSSIRFARCTRTLTIRLGRHRVDRAAAADVCDDAPSWRAATRCFRPTLRRRRRNWRGRRRRHADRRRSRLHPVGVHTRPRDVALRHVERRIRCRSLVRRRRARPAAVRLRRGEWTGWHTDR